MQRWQNYATLYIDCVDNILGTLAVHKNVLGNICLELMTTFNAMSSFCSDYN